MTVEIYDIDGTPRTAAWLAAAYDGCYVLPANTAGASEYWRLAAVYCTTGPAVLKAEARRGVTPAANQPIVLSWPSLAEPSEHLLPLPPSPHNWSERGVIQRTEASGVTGFGLGSTYGPFYSTWVLSSAPSDCLTKTGMKGSTEHAGPLHAVFILTPVAPSFSTIQEAMLYWAAVKQVLQLNPEAALQNALLRDGYIATSPEFDVEQGGKQWIGQRAERQDNGAVRVYWVERGKWDTVYHVDR